MRANKYCTLPNAAMIANKFWNSAPETVLRGRRA